MTRHFLLLFVLAFALTLGWWQRVPVPALITCGSLCCLLIFLSRPWVSGIGYVLVGGILASMCMMVRLPGLTVSVGQENTITGLVTKTVGQESWVKVTHCSQRPCIAGVILAKEIPLGDTVHVRCELLPLKDPQQPWKWWKQGIAATCLPVQRVVHEPDQWLGKLYRFRVALRNRIDESFTPRSAGLLAGIIFGDTSSMPIAVSTDFRRTGTTHIVALSGFNITIILQTVVAGLLPLVGKRWTTILGLLLVVVFVVTTGASSSVVRAAVMAAVLQGVKLSGRPVHPDRVILLTVVMMSLQNPWLLWHDLGFQLSMTSTFGLLQLRDRLEVFGRWLPEFWELRDNAVSTMAASLASAPILLVTFGGWSLISLLANIVVLPLIPMIMGLGAMTLPFLWLPESWRLLVTAPVDLLLRSVLGVLHQLAQVPWAYTLVPTWGILIAITLSLIGISLCYAYSQRSDR